MLYPLDLEGATPDDYAELAARIGERFGRLDGLVHCAADFPGLTPLAHTDPAAFARALHVGLTARWWLTQACLPLLQASASGSVVFVIDPAPAAAPAYWGGYGVAQHGLEALVAMLAAETAATPLRVHALRPGPMRTPLRARAYAADGDRVARDPSAFAAACVEALAAMLAAETAATPLRVHALRPGPMRTPLRARAYAADGDRVARDPSVFAAACVGALAPAAAHAEGAA